MHSFWLWKLFFVLALICHLITGGCHRSLCTNTNILCTIFVFLYWAQRSHDPYDVNRYLYQVIKTICFAFDFGIPITYSLMFPISLFMMSYSSIHTLIIFKRLYFFPTTYMCCAVLWLSSPYHKHSPLLRLRHGISLFYQFVWTHPVQCESHCRLSCWEHLWKMLAERAVCRTFFLHQSTHRSELCLFSFGNISKTIRGSTVIINVYHTFFYGDSYIDVLCSLVKKSVLLLLHKTLILIFMLHIISVSIERICLNEWHQSPLPSLAGLPNMVFIIQYHNISIHTQFLLVVLYTSVMLIK